MMLAAASSDVRRRLLLPGLRIQRPSPRALVSHYRPYGRAAEFIAGGACLLAVAVCAPYMGSMIVGWRIDSMIKALPQQAPLSLLSPSRPPATDIELTLSLLERDPHIRAERAVYEAALLRPAVGAKRLRALAATTPLAQASLADLVSTGFSILDAEETAVVVSHRFKRRGYDNRPSRPARTVVPGYIDAVLADAAFHVGVDLQYLRSTAARESRFNSYAAARTSSARGLFQFIDSTWLIAVKRWGSRHGLGIEASKISVDATGRAFVEDPQARRRILALRYDPVLSSRLAAESTADNRRALLAAFGREPSAGELYAAHFLGPQGAVRLVTMAYQQPGYPAPYLFPTAAAKNRRLFYKTNNFPRSVSELLLGFH